MSKNPVETLNAKIEAFSRKAAETPELLEKLKVATSPTEIADLARSEGFSLTAEELDVAAKQMGDQELAGVAGGNIEVSAGHMALDDVIGVIMNQMFSISQETTLKQVQMAAQRGAHQSQTNLRLVKEQAMRNDRMLAYDKLR